MGRQKQSRRQPPANDLISLAELAQLAGISEQRARRLLQQPRGLPAPEQRKDSGEPRWRRETVERWCQTPVDAAGVLWRHHPGTPGHEPAPWLLTGSEPDGPAVELFRGVRDVVTPQDGAVQTFTIVWDTPRGHVLYLVPLREMVAPTNELVSYAVAQFIAPRWRLAATALAPWAHVEHSGDPSTQVYRLFADHDEAATEMVPPLLQASVLHPNLPSYVEGAVRKAARHLGTRIPIWMDGTRTMDVATAALRREGTVAVPDFSVWPAVEERLRHAVAAGMPERFPAAWTLVAREAAGHLERIRDEHRKLANAGDDWYLVARPVEPAPPSHILDAVDAARTARFDVDQAVDCLNRLRSANDELDASDPLGVVYDCAIAQLDEWLFVGQLGIRAGAGRGFDYQDHLWRQPDPAGVKDALAKLRQTVESTSDLAPATLAREIDILEIACHSSTSDTGRIERALSTLRGPATATPGYRTLVDEVIAHMSAVLRWRGASDGVLVTDLLRRQVIPAHPVVTGVRTGDTAAHWLDSMQQVPTDERLLRSRRIRRLMPSSGARRGALYRDGDGRYVLLHQETGGAAAFGAEWETSPQAAANWGSGTTIVVDRSIAGRSGPPLVTTPLTDGTMRIDPLPLDPDVAPTRSFHVGDDSPEAQHLYTQLVHLALISADWSGLHLIDALLPVIAAGTGGRLREAVLRTDGPLRLSWPDVQQWAVEEAEAGVAALRNGWEGGFRYFAVRNTTSLDRYAMVVRTWHGAERQSREETFRHFKGVWEGTHYIQRIQFGRDLDLDYAEVNAADLRHFRRPRHITGDCPLCGLVYSFTATRPVPH